MKGAEKRAQASVSRNPSVFFLLGANEDGPSLQKQTLHRELLVMSNCYADRRIYGKAASSQSVQEAMSPLCTEPVSTFTPSASSVNFPEIS